MTTPKNLRIFRGPR